MKQEKGSTFSTRNKLKQPITTPLKHPPLTAKVVSTWNNVLNKNKDRKECKVGKISSADKCERNLRSVLIELKTKIGIVLPGNREVRNMIDNILKTFLKIEQPFQIQGPSNQSKPMEIQPPLPKKLSKIVDIGEMPQQDMALREIINENLKLTQEKHCLEAQLLILKTELNSSKQRIEKLESALNESVNSERETIANYEQQCKRLQNEIKTLQDSASNKMMAINKFKSQTELMAIKDLEKEKLLAILKYDANQMNSSYSEFCSIYELIQKYFSEDRMQMIFNNHLDKKN